MNRGFMGLCFASLALAAFAICLMKSPHALAQAVELKTLESSRGEIPVCCQVGSRKWKTSRQNCRRRRGAKILLLSACQPKLDPKHIPGQRGQVLICCLKGGHVSKVTRGNCRRHPHARIVVASVCHGTVCCQRGEDFFHTTGLECSRRRDQQVLSRQACLRKGVCCQIPREFSIPRQGPGRGSVWTSRSGCTRQGGTVLLNELCPNRPYN